nr:nitroreductase family protein [Streptomyces sp. SID2888]
MAGVEQALLRAGALAHLLCLSATDTGIAITTIGGFDAGRWHALAGIPGENEVLYVALLGVTGASAVKLDRLQRAYAHDER